MKLYTLFIKYWDPADWHKHTVNNAPMNPNGAEALGVFFTEEMARVAMEEIEADEDDIQEIVIYESKEINIKNFLDAYLFTALDLNGFYYEKWREFFSSDFLLFNHVAGKNQ